MHEEEDHQFNFRAATVSAGIKMNPGQQGLICGGYMGNSNNFPFVIQIYDFLRKITNMPALIV